MPQQTFQFSAEVWLYPGMAGWHFVTLPPELAKEIDFFFTQLKKGWGSIPVSVSVGQTTWKTSIFPDKKSQSYLLPLKAEVRKKVSIHEGDNVSFYLDIGS